MKYPLLIALLLSPLAGVAGEPMGDSPLHNHHASTFAELAAKYCLDLKESPQALDARLRQDGFIEDQEFEGVLVKYIDNVDYAVTADTQFCTTDVLLQRESGQLFGLRQLDHALTARLGITEYKSGFATEMSSDENQTLVVRRRYRNDKGQHFELTFPVHNHGEHYMTFNVLLKPQRQAVEAQEYPEQPFDVGTCRPPQAI